MNMPEYEYCMSCICSSCPEHKKNSCCRCRGNANDLCATNRCIQEEDDDE